MTPRQQSLHYELSVSEPGVRLDIHLVEELASFFGSEAPTRSKISRWISDGLVYVNDKQVTKAGIKPKAGDVINIEIPPLADELRLIPDSTVEVETIFEDESVIVVNKPAGLVVHPGAGVSSGTLAHGLASRVSAEAGHPLRPGIVHRLDKDTSGLMVVARTPSAYYNLIEQFVPPRTIKRSYLAITEKLPKTDSEKIETHIARSAKNRTRMEVSNEGKLAVTYWKFLREVKSGYLLELSLETGRTHQIRVHLEHAGAPIIGDPVYNRGLSGKVKFPRQALHAAKLCFLHPESKKELCFETPLPEDIKCRLLD